MSHSPASYLPDSVLFPSRPRLHLKQPPFSSSSDMQSLSRARDMLVRFYDHRNFLRVINEIETRFSLDRVVALLTPAQRQDFIRSSAYSERAAEHLLVLGEMGAMRLTLREFLRLVQTNGETRWFEALVRHFVRDIVHQPTLITAYGLLKRRSRPEAARTVLAYLPSKVRRQLKHSSARILEDHCDVGSDDEADERDIDSVRSDDESEEDADKDEYDLDDGFLIRDDQDEF